VVGGSIVIPHLRRAMARLEGLETGGEPELEVSTPPRQQHSPDD
jgi:hypothetical protein